MPKRSRLAPFCLLAYVLLLTMTCWPTGAPYDLLRLGLGLLGSSLAWPAVSMSILGRGQGAIRRIVWRPDGVFELDLAGGLRDQACLGPGSATLGSCAWLVLHGRRRHYAFITRATAGPADFAALRRRLACLRAA